MNCILKYPGAKNRLADWICSYIPKHKVYVEPFAGSLAVLLNKEPSYLETVNDLDDEIVNYFHVLRDSPHELQKLISMTPYARSEYEQAYEHTENPVERARRFCVRCWMGFGESNLYHNGFRTGQRSSSPNPARAWHRLPEIMVVVSQRLKNVQIEKLDALELISRYDTPDVFMYLDPPYLQETRKSHLYQHEMTDSEHEKLLKKIIKHPGKILISGYDNDMYNDYLTQRGDRWHKVSKHTIAECGLHRTEILWFNYSLEYEQISIFNIEGIEYKEQKEIM